MQWVIFYSLPSTLAATGEKSHRIFHCDNIVIIAVIKIEFSLDGGLQYLNQN